MFPEVLIVDATHKLNDQNMPLYVFLAVGSHGENHIVTTFLVVRENETMVETSLEFNPEWIQIQTVVTDKDFIERNMSIMHEII